MDASGALRRSPPPGSPPGPSTRATGAATSSHLTEDGRRELERLLGVVDEVQERVLEPLSTAERQSLLRLLRLLRKLG